MQIYKNKMLRHPLICKVGNFACQVYYNDYSENCNKLFFILDDYFCNDFCLSCFLLAFMVMTMSTSYNKSLRELHSRDKSILYYLEHNHVQKSKLFVPSPINFLENFICFYKIFPFTAVNFLDIIYVILGENPNLQVILQHYVI